ncbi:uncharacterized protein LOC135349419 [Halichondria panicea]|uniref:uncharacterized protein LOC135349419 n=1 Tax=Halichondria panicea TaxID=6063 RepID=UPI00312B8BEB
MAWAQNCKCPLYLALCCADTVKEGPRNMSSSVSNLYNYSLYTIEKDGKTVKLKPSQLTTQVIGKVFGLFPDSIILISDDGFVETPDHEGKFLDVDDLSKWVVNGDSLKADGLPQDQQVASFSYQPPSQATSQATSRKRGRPPKWSPKFTSALLGASSASGQKPPGVRARAEPSVDGAGPSTMSSSSSSRPEWRKYIEVCKWNEADKQWKKVSNVPIDLSEEIASVPNVSKMVSDELFNGEECVLMDIDYLKIPNTSTTRGSRFWKTSKRIRAVRKSEVKKGRVISLDSSSDSDFDFAPQHRAKKMSLPLAPSSLGTMDKTVFECLVCKSQTSFPAVVSPCCYFGV